MATAERARVGGKFVKRDSPEANAAPPAAATSAPAGAVIETLELEKGNHREGCPERRLEQYEQPRPGRQAGEPTLIAIVTRCQDCGGQTVKITDRIYDPNDPRIKA